MSLGVNAGIGIDTSNPYFKAKLKELQANYKLTPATLLHKINPRWIAAPHLMYISAEIAQAISQGNGRITVSVPPRHGKSELITKGTSIWALERFPHLNVILTSYGAELSTDFGREVRDIIDTNHKLGLLSVSIREDATRVGNWLTPQGGGMRSVGLGGAITGRGAHVLLIDDYIKEIKEALSQAHRDYIWNWFVTTALTRLEPGATVIIIATRWHQDDLIGRIRQNNPGGRWKHIVIPAESLGSSDPKYIKLRDLYMEDPEQALREGYDPEKDVDFLGRRFGEPLFPERYSKEELIERRETLGSHFYSAIYQQEPKDGETAMAQSSWFEIIQPHELPDLNAPYMTPVIRVWDLAATDGAGDYTVGANFVMDKRTGIVYVLSIIRKQLSSYKVEELVKSVAIIDGDIKIYIEQEPGASGKALVEHYQRTVLKDYRVEATPANDGKIIRAQPMFAAAEHGKVKLLAGPWNKGFLAEVDTWPSTSRRVKDDQVDVVAVGYLKLTGKKTMRATFGRRQLANDELHRTLKRNAEEAAAAKSKRERAGIIFGRRRANGY